MLINNIQITSVKANDMFLCSNQLFLYNFLQSKNKKNFYHKMMILAIGIWFNNVQMYLGCKHGKNMRLVSEALFTSKTLTIEEQI